MFQHWFSSAEFFPSTGKSSAEGVTFVYEHSVPVLKPPSALGLEGGQTTTGLEPRLPRSGNLDRRAKGSCRPKNEFLCPGITSKVSDCNSNAGGHQVHSTEEKDGSAPGPECFGTMLRTVRHLAKDRSAPSRFEVPRCRSVQSKTELLAAAALKFAPGMRGYGPVAIERVLKEEDLRGCRQTVSKYLDSLKTDGAIVYPRPGQHGIGKMQVVHLNFIDDAMKNNDELTAPDLQRLLFDRFGLSVSVATVKRHRYAIGWVIREANRNARLLWCQQMLLDGESFDDVIWSDETIIYLDSHAKVDPDYNQKLKPRPKHPTKVYAWAGISKKGRTPILVFKDPKHTSAKASKVMRAWGINWWRTPAESPDLNPIENAWHQMKAHIRKNVKPRNQDQLAEAVASFWKTYMTQEQCCRYINHLYKVMPVVVARRGFPSGY
ncbi:hypothetical protein Bbelb_378360 [Branchiostoma belcheri]|nr:hypothetical protein Bbelb_378360 [Branchiostoma belcheri]